jgi:DNA adenine methylase
VTAAPPAADGNPLKAPFPWFGGKRRVAGPVWDALGDVDHYVEPFAGSLAVLLARPTGHAGTCETVNDADRYLANFWRALIADPEAVAAHADWPVNEADLEARHLWLVNQGETMRESMAADPDWFDPKIAGWWVWGINSWIGSGWCSGTGPWQIDDTGRLSKRPHLGDAGRGINRQRPHLGTAGQGIKRKRPHLGNAGQGINDYLSALAVRLRGVRVICGDWKRVVTRGALSYGSTVGVFLDPPYLGEVRTGDLYATDDHHIANEVREWCLTNGDNPRLRIVLAGYAPEHDHLIPDTWRRHRWTASSAYSSTAAAERQDGNHANRDTEVLWLSPHCLDPSTELTLFGPCQ